MNAHAYSFDWSGRERHDSFLRSIACYAGEGCGTTLFDYLEAGDTIDEFLEGFPTVARDQVIALLEEAKSRMLAETRCKFC